MFVFCNLNVNVAMAKLEPKLIYISKILHIYPVGYFYLSSVCSIRNYDLPLRTCAFQEHRCHRLPAGGMEWLYFLWGQWKYKSSKPFNMNFMTPYKQEHAYKIYFPILLFQGNS